MFGIPTVLSERLGVKSEQVAVATKLDDMGETLIILEKTSLAY